MNALMTYGALWGRGVVPSEQEAIAAFLRFHATEGREALVERVAEAMYDVNGPESGPIESFREWAEAVVTALVGDA